MKVPRNPFPLVSILALGRDVRIFLVAGAVSLLASVPMAEAAPCSYGEVFNFNNTSASQPSQTGTMPLGDIDRDLSVNVVVTNSLGGNLPPGIEGGQGPTGVTSSPGIFSPGFTQTFAPAIYSTWLGLTSSNGTNSNQIPLTFTFSKPMRNLVMHFAGGDNKLFTFTDGSGNPLPFVLRTARTMTGTNALGDPPASGGAANSTFVKQVSTNSVAIGELGTATLEFTGGPVSVIKMTQQFLASASPSPGFGSTYNTGSSHHKINFGQYCDQVGVVDDCTAPHVAEWMSASGIAATGATATGRIVDETGKVISVTYQGGLSATTFTNVTLFLNSGDSPSSAIGGLFLFPVRPALDLVQTSTTNTVAAPAQLTWTFGESVRNPVLALRGPQGNSNAVTLKFYKADGTTPLPFVLRDSKNPDAGRQVDANEFYMATDKDLNNLIQFVGETTGIVLKVSGGSNPFTPHATVILNCNGALSSGIDGDDDGDGVSNLTDKCPATPVGAVVGADGCPLPTDLSIGKTASVTKITPGVPFDYIITVTNTGAEANNVKASDIIPAGLTINSATASNSGTVTTTGQTVQALWAIVPASATRTLTINVTKP